MAGKTKLSQIRDEQMPKRPKTVLSRMSEQERTLREQIANGGQNLGMTFRDPTRGIIEADPVEMLTGMPLTDGNEDYDALTRTALAGAAGMATPRYLQEGYEGPQTGMGPVGDFAAGLGQVFQGGSGAGSMGAPALAVSQFASDIPDAGRALGTMGGTKVPRGLGNKLSDLRPIADAARTEEAFNRQFPGGQVDPGITAYHGSPHTFDKFDMGKIGTGEGAQAYGHGLYFAENEGVAKSYRDQMLDTKAVLRMSPKNKYEEYVLGKAEDYHKELGAAPDRETIEEWLRQDYSPGMKRGGGEYHSRQYGGLEEDDVQRAVARLYDEASGGATYQVRLAVKPDELLDWDKPLSEQPESVRKVLSEKGWDKPRPGFTPGGPEPTGQNAHAWATDRAGAGWDTPGTAAKLKAAGIKGIRYKDGNSRGGEGGTYNYVIFDDSLVTILKRYGIPMTVGAGGAVVVSGANMPPDIAAQLGPQS